MTKSVTNLINRIKASIDRPPNNVEIANDRLVEFVRGVSSGQIKCDIEKSSGSVTDEKKTKS